MTDVTILQGKNTVTGYTSDTTITWGDLSSSPYGSWSNWTTWSPEYDTTVQVQLDDTATQVGYYTPTCDVGYEGDLTIQLKISETGTFTGEETTINFVVGTDYTYVKGRYFRWTITVEANSEYARPRLFFFATGYSTSVSTINLDDVDIPSQSQDSSYGYLVPNDFGIVTNVQATALQGDPYVVDGYYINYVDSGNDRPARVPVYQSGIDIDTSIYSTAPSSYNSAASGTRTGVISYDNTDNAFFDLQRDQTWEMDFRYSDTTVQEQLLFHIGEYNWQFALSIAGGNLRLTVNSYTDDSDRTQLTTYIETPVAEDTWYNTAVVQEYNTFNLYLDGVLKNSLTVPADAAVPTDDDNWTRYFNLMGQHPNQFTGQPGRSFVGNVDNIMISPEARYTGSSYTPPTLLSSMNNILFLDGTDFVDKGGRITEAEDYIVEQRGGIPQVLNKNPLSIIITDYQGAAWDGAVDLVLRGYPQITMTTNGVVSAG